MSSRRQEANNVASDGDSESAESYGTTDHEEDSNSDAGAEAAGSGDPADSSDKGDEGGGGSNGSSDADAKASGSGSEGESAESEDLPSIPNKLPESDIPATAIRRLFDGQLEGVKRKVEGILQKLSQDRYAEIKRRQAERKGSRTQKRICRQQRKYPRVPAQAHLVLMAPDGRIHISMSKEMEDHPQLERATELLTVSLKQLVEGQQLDMHMAAASSAAAAQAPGRSACVHSRFGQPSRGAPSQGNPARGPRKPAPSRELLQAARVVFRTRVRPYLQKANKSGLFSAHLAAAQQKVCGGSSWKDCREQGGCQKDCAALRAEIGWPADLPCVDPNAKGASVDTQWMRDFLQCQGMWLDK